MRLPNIWTEDVSETGQDFLWNGIFVGMINVIGTIFDYWTKTGQDVFLGGGDKKAKSWW